MVLLNRIEVNYREREIMEVGNLSYKRVSQIKYLGSILIRNNYIKVRDKYQTKKT